MSPNEVGIRKAVAKLAATYSGWTPARTEAFVEALADLWVEDVERGVTATLREWKSKDAPAPGFVRQLALEQRSRKSNAPQREPKRGPVAWHEARLPMSDGEDGYLRDAGGRRVMLPPEVMPALGQPGSPSYVPEEW